MRRLVLRIGSTRFGRPGHSVSEHDQRNAHHFHVASDAACPSRDNGTKVVLSFLSIAWYRQAVLHDLVTHFAGRAIIFGGNRAPDPAIRLADPAQLPYVVVTNRWLPGDLWVQRLPWRTLIASDLLILDLNPRLLHVWILTAVRRLRRRPTLLWGHAWPRAGRESRTTPIRMALVQCADGVITYTQLQATELAERVRTIPVFPAPNALYRKQMFQFDPAASRNAFIYVGRMVAEKKPELLIRAYARAVPMLSDEELIMVGDGAQLDYLRELAGRLGVANSVRFMGHIDDYDRLQSLYAKAIASVSPGYVGLSATQSLSFGVPMLVADLEAHAPEIEAIQPGMNGAMFISDSIDSLAHTLVQFHDNSAYWAQAGPEISASCQERYSVERMCCGLITAIERFIG